MNLLQRYTCKATLIGFCLAAASGAYAQISSINSAFIDQRVWNDIPTATLTTVASYPSTISFNEANVSGTGYANRDVWYFSNNGGTSPYQFNAGDYFTATMNVTLTGSASAPDLEAGFLFSNPSGAFGGDCQFILHNNGEIVQFGGPSFYGFNAGHGGPLPNYVLGQTITLGFSYLIDPNTGMNAFQYSANGVLSPYFDLGGPVGNAGDYLGGYFQIQQDPNNSSNFGEAVFGDISIVPVPEPSTLAFLGLGMVTLLLRRRHI